jgi:hypothetical protein
MIKLSLRFTWAFVAGLGLPVCAEVLVGARNTQAPYGELPVPTWGEKYGAQYDQPFSGPLSFSHLPYALCLQDETALFDIAILGMPFDTSVSYRPGCDPPLYQSS